MSSSNNNGAMIGLIWLITIGISIASGVMAWNWIEPKSFFGAIVFLIMWAVFSRIGHFIGVLLVALFEKGN